MSFIRNAMFPSSQNMIQRVGLFVTAFLIALLLLLHFPFGGYATERFELVRRATMNCPPRGTLEDLKTMTREDLEKSGEQMKLCSDLHELQTLPFLEWRSISPVVAWLGSVLNFLVTVVFAVCLGAAWLWIFRSSTTDPAKPKPE